LEIYVRNGIYTLNEARDILGYEPVPGGETPMVYGQAGATPLGADKPLSRTAGEGGEPRERRAG
jgi:hypothetical protein